MDVIVQVWWLAWAPFALFHGQNIFAAHWLNYPAGQNFGVNGSMLALGIVFLPITRLFGVVVTWNIALRLAVAVSAASMCFVLRRWTTWWPAAFLGGLLYGFSGYMGRNGDYLFLIFVPLPPVVFLLIHEILVRQHWKTSRTGLLLGVVCAIQFFLSTEILATTAVMGTLAVALFVLSNRQILMERWRYAVTAFAYSIGVVSLLLFYPLWYTFAGAQHINGPPFATASLALLPADLLSPFVPIGEWFDPRQLALVGTSFTYGGLLYLGIPLVIALVIFAVVLRKRREILFAGTLALIAFVLSLGSRLYVDGHGTHILLPFATLERLPTLNGLLASRFSLYTALFASGMFAVGMDELWRRLRQTHRLVWLSGQVRKVVGTVALVAIAGAVALPLVPSHSQPSARTNVPSFFTSKAIESIPPGSVALAYPYPDLTSTSRYSVFLTTRSVMLDQAVTGMQFKLIGGYGWFPSPKGHSGTTAPALLEPQSVQTLFDVELSGGSTAAQRMLLSKSNLSSDIRQFLRKYDVQTVMVIHAQSIRFGTVVVQGRDSVIKWLTSAIGSGADSGGVTVWLHVEQRLDRKS